MIYIDKKSLNAFLFNVLSLGVQNKSFSIYRVNKIYCDGNA